MRIAVCMSQVLDPDRVAELALAGLLRLESANGSADDAAHVARVANHADRQALSKAVTLAASLSPAAEVVVLSAGASRPDELCTEALQMGAASVVHVDCDLSGADVAAVASLLHAALLHAGGAELVLAGTQTSGGDGGATAAALAALLDVSCFVGVRDLAGLTEASVRATQVHSGGERELEVALPALLTVYDDAWKPPVLNPRHLIAARDKRPLRVTPGELGFDDARLRAARMVESAGVEVPLLPNRCELLGDGDAAAAVDALLARLHADGVL